MRSRIVTLIHLFSFDRPSTLGGEDVCEKTEIRRTHAGAWVHYKLFSSGGFKKAL